MKKIFFLLAVGLIFQASSCEDEIPVIETGRVELNIVTEYEGNTLAMFEDKMYPEFERQMRFKNVEFFLSDLVLLEDGTADETELSEVELIKFDGLNTQELAERGESRGFSDIPAGTYSGIRMGLGVNRDLNRDNNGEYAPGDPLGQNYWAGWNSYIFAKFEGDIDFSNDGDYDDTSEDLDPRDVVFTLHTGANEAYRTVTINTPIVVEADGTVVVKLGLDLHKLFLPDNGTVYAINEPNMSSTHTNLSIDAIGEIMDNFSRAFTLE